VLTEAETCRTLVVPRLQAAGWDDLPHAINEQRTFADGRIVFLKEYAEILGLKLAYATNGAATGGLVPVETSRRRLRTLVRQRPEHPR
jgi:hypothetical protein